MSDATRDPRPGFPSQVSVGPGWFIGILLLAAVIVGVLAFDRFNGAGAGQDTAAVRTMPSSGAADRPER